MKIVIAPSKTMVRTEEKPKTKALFDYRYELLESLKAKDVKSLQMLFDVNENIAKQNHLRFQNFTEDNIAIYSYTGQQFKHLDAPSLTPDALDYLQDKLFIMSGLYGLVRPYDGVGLYRMPMGVKWNNTLHKNNWKPIITNHLQGQTIINLASKEYYDAIDPKQTNLITIDFMVRKNDKVKKAPAMEAKKLRGKMVRLMALNNVNTLDAIKSMNIDDYQYDQESSDETNYKFRKN